MDEPNCASKNDVKVKKELENSSMEGENVPLEAHFIKSEPSDIDMYLPEDDFPDDPNLPENDPLEMESATLESGSKILQEDCPKRLEMKNINSFNVCRYVVHSLTNMQPRHEGGIMNFHCPACNSGFASLALYKTHVCFVTPEDQDSYTGFCCMYCKAKLPSRNGLMDHVQKSHVANKLCCKICFQEFGTSECLREHILKDHVPQKCTGQKIASLALQGVREGLKLECPKCDYVHSDLDDFSDHVLIHRPHICSLCRCKEFAVKNDLLGHLKLHIGQYGFVCSVCKSRCPSVKILEKHKRFPATWCIIKKLSKDTYMKHVIGHIETEGKWCQCLKCIHESREKIRCFVCHTWWTSEANAKEHIKQCILEHRTQLPKKICHYCYWMEAYVQDEIEKIKEAEENSCFYCDLPFKKPRFLYLHYLKHHPTHKEKCYMCKKCFRLTADLKIHKLLHLQRKKNPYCSKCFKSLHNLWDQKEMENTQQLKTDNPKVLTLTCVGCDDTFDDEKSLEHHTQTECFNLQESEDEEMEIQKLMNPAEVKTEEIVESENEINDIGNAPNVVEVKKENTPEESSNDSGSRKLRSRLVYQIHTALCIFPSNPLGKCMENSMVRKEIFDDGRSMFREKQMGGLKKLIEKEQNGENRVFSKLKKLKVGKSIYCNLSENKRRKSWETSFLWGMEIKPHGKIMGSILVPDIILKHSTRVSKFFHGESLQYYSELTKQTKQITEGMAVVAANIKKITLQKIFLITFALWKRICKVLFRKEEDKSGSSYMKP